MNTFLSLVSTLLIVVNSPSEITAKSVINAIENENFSFIENAMATGQLRPNDVFNGKTLLIHAVMQDKAEMINLLVSRGANIYMASDEGLIPMDYAIRHNKVHAQAELIVISS